MLADETRRALGPLRRCFLFVDFCIVSSKLCHPFRRRAVLNREDSGGDIALCPELDIASQGESVSAAIGTKLAHPIRAVLPSLAMAAS